METLEIAVREYIASGNKGGYTIAKKYKIDHDMDAFWAKWEELNQDNIANA